MKKFKVISAVLAVMIAMSLSACGKEESKPDSTDETQAVSETVPATEAQTETEPETEAETQPQYEGLVIENTAYGYTIAAPEGIDSSDSKTALTGVVSITDDFYMLKSLESDDNLNIAVGNVISEDEWNSYTKESLTSDYNSLYEQLGVNTTCEVTKLEKSKISGCDAYFITTIGKNEDGTEFTQTQVIVNRQDSGAEFSYTFTYTDYTGTLDMEESIKSISFTAADGPAEAVGAVEDANAGEPFVFDCGLEFTAPEGWKLDTEEASHNVEGSELEFTSPNENAYLYVTVSETADDEETFNSYTEQDIETTFGASFESCEVNSFENIEISGYKAIKASCTGKYGDMEIKQTVLMINCPDKDKGICVLLSDFDGGAEDISNMLEKTVEIK